MNLRRFWLELGIAMAYGAGLGVLFYAAFWFGCWLAGQP